MVAKFKFSHMKCEIFSHVVSKLLTGFTEISAETPGFLIDGRRYLYSIFTYIIASIVMSAL